MVDRWLLEKETAVTAAAESRHGVVVNNQSCLYRRRTEMGRRSCVGFQNIDWAGYIHVENIDTAAENIHYREVIAEVVITEVALTERNSVRTSMAKP